MAPPPRQVRLTMDAFPDCPQEFRGTLERLLALLNETQTAVAAALNRQLTRAENMRGGYVTGTGSADGDGLMVVQTRNPLGAQAPAAVWVVRLRIVGESADAWIRGPWFYTSWRTIGDGQLELAVRGLAAGGRYTLTAIVE